MIKKITALLLVLLCCISFSACGKNDEIPEGMQSATLQGEPFILYVPENWALNTNSGLSSAYVSAGEKILVNARYYTPANPEMTLNDYMDFCAEQYAKTQSGFTIVERTPSILSGENAVKMVYTMTLNGREYTCFQTTARWHGDMVSIHGYCPTEFLESINADFDRIHETFVLCDKGELGGAEIIDKNTPAGMKIASADQIEYRLYVPKTWVCNPEEGNSYAFYPESERSNVTVNCYSPEQSMSVSDYFAQCEVEYKKVLPSYERLSETERTVADREAKSYIYRTVVEGVELKLMQTVFTYSGKFYSITYTATAENFDLHMADVESILNAFIFR